MNVPFDAGAPIGIGFSLRNTGSVPLTVVSIESLGAFSPIWLAELHAALPQEGEPFSPDRPRPFEPVTIAPGEEATIQFTGNVRDCAAVRGHWVTGGSIGFTTTRLKVRWLLITKDIEIPLRQSLQVETPAIDQCIPPPIDSMRG